MKYQTKETALVIKSWDDLPYNFSGIAKYGNSYFWLFYKQRHRIDGPAIEWYDGTKSWFVDGRKHREDGPAYIFANGDREWWLNDIHYRQEEWFEELTPEQKEKAVWNMDNW